MFHLDSELIFKDSQEEIKEYPFSLSEEVEDPEFVEKKSPPPASADPSSSNDGISDEQKATEEAEDADEKGCYSPNCKLLEKYFSNMWILHMCRGDSSSQGRKADQTTQPI